MTAICSAVRRIRAALALFGLGFAAACSTHGLPTVRDDSNGVPRLDANFPSGDQNADAAALDDLRVRMRAIARTDGCTADSSCAVVAYGARGCGGPSGFVVYCRRTTDEARLRAAADEVTRAERAFNTRYQIASTCEARAAPGVGVAGGACVARPSAGPAFPTSRVPDAPSIRSLVPDVAPDARARSGGA